MILIDFYLDGFKVSGHAQYDDVGKDIVCSAISGICFGSINWFDQKDILIFESDQSKPELVLKLKMNQRNKIGISLIETQVKTISDSYSQFCKFKKYNKELEK
ncbi:ribosomal-processing cysteine protease Prp [Malacoplasma penetrans]|uniref:Ribosomal processing cysteine protease Prp n=1 Tax=Malacoplasma penetrans (strain HF-2) TaxID=272633 RepID=Q8EVW6_MALP2|nr:ribosomal-processing cysteine protease Prp [Malacoplasma penetrans]RXY97235.1 ribosomal-processing cysteine protease Prp [Malacoplasma penetrans]BAC44233.1 conserved hypothetical protein [Malacoplasma penetrans HF-2]